MLQVLWFKRDLRLNDHAALCAAALRGPVLPLFIVEPDYWQQPDVSARQWQYWRGCIGDLQATIAQHNGSLVIRAGDAVAVMEALRQTHGPFTQVMVGRINATKKCGPGAKNTGLHLKSAANSA
jgi:deoxyribodipyrimidine photo-lyase